jgi:hypothetical protein
MEANYLLRCAERDRDAAEKKLVEERAAMQLRYVEMLSEIEALKQKIVAVTNLGRDFNQVESADARKAAVLGDVADGKFCAHCAAPPAEVQKEAAERLERIEEQCQTKNQ